MCVDESAPKRLNSALDLAYTIQIVAKLSITDVVLQKTSNSAKLVMYP